MDPGIQVLVVSWNDILFHTVEGVYDLSKIYVSCELLKIKIVLPLILLRCESDPSHLIRCGIFLEGLHGNISKPPQNQVVAIPSLNLAKVQAKYERLYLRPQQGINRR